MNILGAVRFLAKKKVAAKTATYTQELAALSTMKIVTSIASVIAHKETISTQRTVQKAFKKLQHNMLTDFARRKNTMDDPKVLDEAESKLLNRIGSFLMKRLFFQGLKAVAKALLRGVGQAVKLAMRAVGFLARVGFKLLRFMFSGPLGWAALGITAAYFTYKYAAKKTENLELEEQAEREKLLKEVDVPEPATTAPQPTPKPDTAKPTPKPTPKQGAPVAPAKPAPEKAPPVQAPQPTPKPDTAKPTPNYTGGPLPRTSYSKTTVRNWLQARSYIKKAAEVVGVDAGLLAKIAAFESNFDPTAVPFSRKLGKLLSSAHGYGQFLDATWADMVYRHGAKYGFPITEVPKDRGSTKAARDAWMKNLIKITNQPQYRNNAWLQALMLAEFTKENLRLGTALGGSGDPDATVYAMHNLGAGDAKKLFAALNSTPNKAVGTVLSSAVVTGNPSLYADGSISVQEAYARMGSKMRNGELFAVDVKSTAPVITAENIDTILDTKTQTAKAPPNKKPQQPQTSATPAPEKVAYRKVNGVLTAVNG